MSKTKRTLMHRSISVLALLALSGSAVWFDFETLCVSARSQNDYLELANRFQTVILSDVPRMTARDASAARLPDEFAHVPAPHPGARPAQLELDPNMMQDLRNKTKIVMVVVALSFVGLMVFDWGMDITGQRSATGTGELGRVNGEPIRYELTLEPTERRDLLVLDLPGAAPQGSRLNGELTAVVAEPINNLMRYQGSSLTTARYTSTLRDWQRRAALSLPEGRDPRTQALGRRWAAETSNPEELTRRFLALLRSDFKYSISVPPLGYHATDEFLFDTRQGFCEHYSSAFAILMRAAGVPARVLRMRPGAPDAGGRCCRFPRTHRPHERLRRSANSFLRTRWTKF